MTRDADDTLDFNSPPWRYLTSFPPQYRRFVDGGREKLAELLKAHSVVVFTVLRNRRGRFHNGIRCISCNSTQAKKLHDAITMENLRIGRVAP